jgi:hypothetical protein
VQRDETLCVVLCGGDNSTQQKDIERAKRLAPETGGLMMVKTRSFDAAESLE